MPRARSATAALLRGRCPRCREGRIFASLVRMAPACAVCGADFEREQGYFLGAMYFSYGFGVALLAAPVAVLIFADVDMRVTVGASALFLLVAAPWLFRWSRIVWLHFDHRFDPLPDRAARKLTAEDAREPARTRT